MWQTVGILIEDFVLALVSIIKERAGQAQQQQQSLRPNAKNLWASVGSGLDGLECLGVDFPDCVVLNGQEHRGPVPYSIILRK